MCKEENQESDDAKKESAKEENIENYSKHRIASHGMKQYAQWIVRERLPINNESF